MRDLEGLKSIAHEIQARGGGIVTVSMDRWEDLGERELMGRHGMNMIADPTGRIVRKWGLEDLCFDREVPRPAAFVIGPTGRVHWRHLPESWRIRPGPDDYLEAFHKAARP